MTAFSLTAEQIQKRATEIRPARVLLFMVGGLFWAVGWVVSKSWLVLWTALSWGLAAAEVGWKDARRPSGRDGP